jgi:hypothetical protein
LEQLLCMENQDEQFGRVYHLVQKNLKNEELC